MTDNEIVQAYFNDPENPERIAEVLKLIRRQEEEAESRLAWYELN